MRAVALSGAAFGNLLTICRVSQSVSYILVILTPARSGKMLESKFDGGPKLGLGELEIVSDSSLTTQHGYIIPNESH